MSKLKCCSKLQNNVLQLYEFLTIKMRYKLNNSSPNRQYKVNTQVSFGQRGASSMHTTCGVILTVRHILTKYYQYINDFKKYNIPPYMDEALGPKTSQT